MTAPYDPAQNQPSSGNQQPAPPTAQFPQVPAGQYPPPPAGQYPPSAVPPPTRKRPWLVPTLIGVAVVVVLCCGGGLAIGLTSDDKKSEVSTSADLPAAGTSTSTPAAAAPTTAAPAPPSAKPAPATKPAVPDKPKTFGTGDKVRGGDFEFTVNSVKCGISQVGSDFLNKKAQGTFCRAIVTVKNVTKSAHTFHADGTITAQDGSGREYEADGEAAIYGNTDGQGFLDKINPGNSVKANVYFDVPKGTKLKTITFDAGLFTLAEDAVVTL
ncbi:DUF4352 domain-containing protein [Micromonospora sp. NIE79]|uniref:DUF4352 domain-containing protein n=1 Tax=Micromonospora trifolii TaxID=2911208 RepID=A0ABS9N476_9ACTN|nr:DUF4352 domain-containing protein [Micromonospora trifolii]MCG5444523.1 DUF4352 domain-containing protein [Micromonospora trifolii]